MLVESIDITKTYLSLIHPSFYVVMSIFMIFYYYKRTMKYIIKGAREFGFSKILRFMQLQWIAKSLNQLQLMFAKDYLN